ncbi:AAA family ATPase [Exiguobacterium alkaliphilum]|uniref:AAA family ATPase n=1 Tax=Exiguobacterium alkaliphilum TaxID=1428684 RepID=UPI001BA71624|nr:AAA family ATPase [Exiguobacterium alkaliphilum]QUE87975.1 AAA family ATPase [Exiguobacterium alkaliphilum]
MSFKIDLNSTLSKILLTEVFEELENEAPIKYSKKKLEFAIAKAQQYTNDFKITQNLESFLDYLIQSDSDIKYIKQDIFKFNQQFSDDVPQDLYELGYFLKNQKNHAFIGRESELEFLKLSISRKIKNNLIIVGNPGVGKTSLVQEFASNSKTKIFVLELNRVLSNTKYRGSFEEKLTRLLDIAIQKRIAIFIDEIHILLSGGKAEGGFSAADLIKPYLTDPSLVIIGATTTDEYEIIASDKALERRFNIIYLDNMPKQTIKNIYLQLVNELQINSLSIDDFENVFQQLNNITNRNYPDKLIDFLDLFDATEKFHGKTTINEIIAKAFYEQKETQYSN